MSARFGLLAAMIAATASAGPVWLSLPPQAPCGFEAMASSLRARLAGAVVANGASPASNDVQISVESEGDGWTLVIVAPGQPALRRPLGDAQDCVAFSEEAALIADRYLQSIQWSAAPAEVNRLPPPPPPPPTNVLVELGGGGSLGLSGVVVGGGLGIGARRGSWQAELGASYLGSGSIKLATTTPTGATLTQYTGAAQLLVGRVIKLTVFRFRFELGGGAELYWSDATSDSPSAHPNPLPHEALKLTPIGFAAARAGFDLAITTRLFVSLGVEARLHLGQARLGVEGYPQAFVTHLVDGDAMLSVGYLFF